jgi:PAS domain S-box-containing protein
MNFKRMAEGSSFAESAHARLTDNHVRFVLDSLVDYAVITFDNSNCIASWNRGAERLLGYTEEEVVGQSGRIFFTIEDIVNGEVEREIRTAEQQGRAEDERWHVRKNGVRFWASGMLFPLRGDDGRLYGYVKVMRDLTDRRQMQEGLRVSEEHFRLLIDNIRDVALFDLDPAGCISGWNPGAARIFGYEDEEILGESAKRLFTPEDVRARYMEGELERTAAEGRAEDERWVVRKDGSRFFAHWVTNAIRDESGELRGFVKVLRDETERKRNEEERDHLETLRREFLEDQLQSTGAALHTTKEELRALAARLLQTQEGERRRIARELHDDVMQKIALLEVRTARLRVGLPEVAESVSTELREIERHIGSVADEVRNLSHRLHPAILDDIGIEAALRSLIDEFAEHRSQTVQFEACNVAADVPSDVATTLYRITQEALRNIRKHAGNATVTVRLTGKTNQLDLFIEDDGPGFDLFRCRRGVGLGLISIEERVHLIGGRVIVESSPGQGTKIHVTAPLGAGA